MKYKFKYKKKGSFFWKSKEVIGHSIEYYDDTIFNSKKEIIQINKKPQNAMILYYEDGSIERISNWNNYDLRLEKDWVLVTKQSMEKEIGQDIRLNI